MNEIFSQKYASSSCSSLRLLTCWLIFNPSRLLSLACLQHKLNKRVFILLEIVYFLLLEWISCWFLYSNFSLISLQFVDKAVHQIDF